MLLSGLASSSPVLPTPPEATQPSTAFQPPQQLRPQLRPHHHRRVSRVRLLLRDLHLPHLHLLMLGNQVRLARLPLLPAFLSFLIASVLISLLCAARSAFASSSSTAPCPVSVPFSANYSTSFSFASCLPPLLLAHTDPCPSPFFPPLCSQQSVPVLIVTCVNFCICSFPPQATVRFLSPLSSLRTHALLLAQKPVCTSWIFSG